MKKVRKLVYEYVIPIDKENYLATEKRLTEFLRKFSIYLGRQPINMSPAKRTQFKDSYGNEYARYSQRERLIAEILEEK